MYMQRLPEEIELYTANKKFELSKADRLEKQLIDYKISLLEKENSNSLTYSLIFSKNISFKDLKPTSNEI